MGFIAPDPQLFDEVTITNDYPEVSVKSGDKGSIVAILDNEKYSIKMESGVTLDLTNDHFEKIQVDSSNA